MSVGLEFHHGALWSPARTRHDPLIGRGPEVARLRSLVDSAWFGGRVLVILGDAGMGKSVLVADLARHARSSGLLVLTITGRESEANLAFAGLHQLLRPIAASVTDLPEQQRSALQGALGLTAEPGRPDRLPTAMAVLTVLSAASERRPILVVVDDAHWLDRSSLDMLAFAGRRFDTERVVLVMAGRGSTPPAGLGFGFPELRLDPLSAVDANRLLDAQPRPPRGRARSQVLTQAAGNPLALVELARVIAADASAGQRFAQEPLPLSDGLSAVLATGFSSLPEPTRAALLVAAVADSAGLSAATCGKLGLSADALAPAELLGLVKVGRSGLQFHHPLARSAIYHNVPFADRAAAHRQLADALEDEPDRQAWHLAVAALRPDEQVASLLESTAARAQHRGGAAAAALALERAAELSPDRKDKARRLIQAASTAVLTGQADWVHDLANRALAITADPELRVVARRAAGWALAWTNQHADAFSVLLAVADEAAADQPAVAWDALGTAAFVAYQSGATASRQSVSRTMECLERRGQPLRSDCATADSIEAQRTWIRASTNPFADRSELVARLRCLDAAKIMEPSLPGTVAWILDEPDLAAEMLREAVHRLHSPAVRGASGAALSILARAYLDTGRWDDALTVAAQASDLAGAHQMDIVAASAGVTTAMVLALRAETDAARTRASMALALVDPAESRCISAQVRHAIGVAAFADGSHLMAYAQLRQLFHQDGTPLHYHLSYLGIADLAAAAVRANRQMEGRDIVDRALSYLDGALSPRLEQLTARARGLLAEPSRAGAYFDKALSDPAGNRWPFERAQLQLDYAEWLRRQRRINDAKPILAAALETFGGLGAKSWARRAEAELRACGISTPDAPAPPEALSELTPQQREIIRLASDGLTNREIADRLFISPRTVGSHLYRSYPKLGVAGRHQLRTVIASS
jgi:DNA-binding CsgD family transcriptional regulator/tetratricopeptide (TPR) repeat protein